MRLGCGLTPVYCKCAWGMTSANFPELIRNVGRGLVFSRRVFQNTGKDALFRQRRPRASNQEWESSGGLLTEQRMRTGGGGRNRPKNQYFRSDSAFVCGATQANTATTFTGRLPHRCSQFRSHFGALDCHCLRPRDLRRSPRPH